MAVSRPFARIAAATAGVTGTIGLLIVVAGDQQAEVLTASGATVRPMEPWSGLSLLFISAALGVLALRRESVLVRRSAMVVAVLVLAASVTSMTLHFVGASPAEGTLFGMLFRTRVLGGLVLAMAALALLLMALGRNKTTIGATGLGLLIIGGSMLIALAYGGPLFIQREWPMVGLPAAFATSFYGIALIFANGEAAWPLKHFVGPSVSALLLRFLLPVVALSVLLTDAASNLLFSQFSPAIGSTFNTIMSLTIASIVIASLGRLIGGRLDRSYAALRASEDKFRRVFKALPAGLAVSRLHDGRFVDVNDEFVKTYGFTKEEVLGKTSTELGIWAASEDRARLIRSLEVGGGNQRDLELNMKAKGGRDISLRTSIHVLDLDGEPSMISTFIDVTERKRLEAERARADAQHAAIFAESPVALIISDAQTGIILDVNRAYVQLVQARSASELIGKTAADLGFWSADDRRTKLIEPLQKFGRVDGAELSFTNMQGELRQQQIWASFYEGDGKRYILSSLIDITERKRAEAARARADAQLAAIFRESPIPLSVTNVGSGKLVAINPAFVEAYGATSEEKLLGKSRGELGIWGPEVRQTIVELLRQGKRAQGIFPVRRLDGVMRTFQVSASTYTLDGEQYSLGASMDITDRLQLEEERAKAQKQYQELFSGVRDVVFSLSPDGIITVLNPAFETVTGMRTIDWVGKSFLELVHTDDAERAMHDLQQSLSSQTRDGNPIRIKTAKGFRSAEIISAPRLEEGRVVGILGIGRDVSDRVTLEEQLRQSQKMDAIGRLAGGIAHDFNNLLTVIIGMGQMVLESMDKDSSQAADIREVVKAGDRAAEMTRQLLAFSRKQVIEPRDLDVNSVVTNIEKMLRRMIGEHIKLVTSPMKGLDIVRADAGQIEQVVVNLVVNARDAMPKGGTVTMTTSNAEVDAAFAARIPDAKPGAYVRLSVSDTGSGMSPEIQTRIFEPFFTTKELGKGTGLGLSTVFGIVQQAGGFIHLDSEVGRGTTFNIYLPRAESSKASGQRQSIATTILKGTETILVVEDTPAIRDLAVRILQGYGYTVLSALGGDEALQVSAGAGKIDMLITDVVMPGMGGRDLADKLAATRPGLKVIYMSGFTDDTLSRQGVLEEGIELLPKPFTPKALGERVRMVLDGYN